MYFLYPSAAQMPAKYHSNKVKPRGVSNRNRGLDWIRANATKGVIYFADDDNSYDVTLLEQVSGIIEPLEQKELFFNPIYYHSLTDAIHQEDLHVPGGPGN